MFLKISCVKKHLFTVSILLQLTVSISITVYIYDFIQQERSKVESSNFNPVFHLSSDVGT